MKKLLILLSSLALFTFMACGTDTDDHDHDHSEHDHGETGVGGFVSTHQQSDGGSYHVDAVPQSETIVAGENFDIMVTINLDDGAAEFPDDLELTFSATSGEMEGSVEMIHHPSDNSFHLQNVNLPMANVEWTLVLNLDSEFASESVSFRATPASE